MPRLLRPTKLLNQIALVGLISLLAMIFFFAPTELTMGNVHRLLYFHVGTAWTASLTFFFALVAGAMYLRTRDTIWDYISMGSVEIGLVLFTITIAAGAIWGKPAWGVYWVWSPRLILVTVMWLVYVAYLMLRGAVEDPAQRARFAAVYVIAAFATVMVTYVSVRIWRDIHPVVVGGVTETVAEASASEGNSEFASGIESARMGMTLAYSCLVFMLIYWAWLANRVKIELLRVQSNMLKSRLAAHLRG